MSVPQVFSEKQVVEICVDCVLAGDIRRVGPLVASLVVLSEASHPGGELGESIFRGEKYHASSEFP